MNTPGSSGQKIRLRRIPCKQEIIKKNLVNVQQNALKKKLAQAHYYNKNKGQNQSPLKRQGGMQTRAIQNRLGAKNIQNTVIFTNKNQRQVQNLGGNNTNQKRKFVQRKRLNQQSVQKFVVNNNTQQSNRVQKFYRRQSVQDRITQIRQNGKPFKLQQVPQIAPNKLKLRRQQMATNYEIQISTQQKQQTQRVLNPQLQAEIKAIQNRAQPIEETPVVSPVPTKIGVTGITLNERFTNLM